MTKAAHLPAGTTPAGLTEGHVALLGVTERTRAHRTSSGATWIRCDLILLRGPA